MKKKGKLSCDKKTASRSAGYKEVKAAKGRCGNSLPSEKLGRIKGKKPKMKGF
jgi:hypothetical protein